MLCCALATLSLLASPPEGHAALAADDDLPLVEPARRGTSEPGAAFQPERAPFLLTVDRRLVTWNVMGVPVLPGQRVRIQATAGGRLHAATDDGAAIPLRGEAWHWDAPDSPGIQAVRIQNEAGQAVHLNFLVMRPATDVRRGVLDGFRIGTYHADPDPGSAYAAPAGFIEVRPGDEDVLLSPHFTLGQFLCKQPGEPRFAVVSPALITKLEAVLEEANAEGFRASTLHVMSGFRTPWYNRSIGNRTTRSRHLWGDAADVWVDGDGDGEMDDLNRDGRVDLADARALAAVVERVERSAAPEIRPGGIGLYKRNRVHGPFVHVDARGHEARW